MSCINIRKRIITATTAVISNNSTMKRQYFQQALRAVFSQQQHEYSRRQCYYLSTNFHTSAHIHKKQNAETYEPSNQKWIPPTHNPLGFDNDNEEEGEVDLMELSNDDILKLIENDPEIDNDSVENVQYVDMDQMDLSHLDTSSENNNSMWEQVSIAEISKEEEEFVKNVFQNEYQKNATRNNDEEDMELTIDIHNMALKEQQRKEESKKVEQSLNKKEAKEEDGPEWLRARRTKLGIAKPMKGNRGDKVLPIIANTLLSAKEIMSCLQGLHAKDIKLMQEPSLKERMKCSGGIIIATGTTFGHLRLMADTIVRNLRQRKLDKSDVVGATHGYEGGDSNAKSKRKRRKRREQKELRTNSGGSKRIQDGWLLIDCRNYIIHLQDEMTRRTIDLEGLWSSDNNELKKLNAGDEDAVDQYIASNPIPDEYLQQHFSSLDDDDDESGERRLFGGGDDIRYSDTLKKSGRWTPVGAETKKGRNKYRKKRS